MPEIQFESHRGRNVAIGVGALVIALLVVLAVIFRGPINDLLYRLGILRLNVVAVLSDAEKQRVTGGNEKGIDVLNESLKRVSRNDDKARIYGAIAVYNFELNRTDEALKYFEMKRKLMPNDHRDSIMYARALRQAGREEEASKYYQEALEEVKSHPENPMLSSDVKSIEAEMKQQEPYEGPQDEAGTQ